MGRILYFLYLFLHHFSLLEFVPLTHMPRGVQTVLADVCLKREEQVLVFGHCDGPWHAKEQRVAGRSTPSSSREARKKRKNRNKKKKKKKQQQQAQVLDRRSLGQSYLLCFVCCVLVAVVVKALRSHLGSV
jgi:hypothetical protein